MTQEQEMIYITADDVPEPLETLTFRQSMAPVTDARRTKAAMRPFMVWDGEGVTHPGNTEMSYVLFGYAREESVTTGDTGSECITGKDLRTDQLLEFIYEHANPYYIHVSFGFSFDVDQITKDIPDDHLRMLVQEGRTFWHDWIIDYIPRKAFRLKRKGKGNRQVTIFDVMSFFNTSLVKAANQYVPNHPYLAKVEAGKDMRAIFQYKDLDPIIRPYWELENQLLLATMEALRHSLHGAKIYLRHWHGPGSVGNALINSNHIGPHIKRSREDMPDEVTDAAQFAFFGGRFESAIMGHIPGPIYAYDLRSAYPAALAEMPGLSGGEWQHEYSPESISEWGVYRYHLRKEDSLTTPMGFGPFPNRAPNGTVSYALSGTGWIYGHELSAALQTGWKPQILEGWTYDGSNTRPFIFTKEFYIKRAQYKRNGNPAQYACKIGMNSVWGKLAQTVGWDDDLKVPPRFHHSWYAGHVTSWCRARMLLAISQSPNSIIGVETDGIYSLKPLRLRIGEHLGEWEETIYDEMYYVQSGFYFARKGKCPEFCPHEPDRKDSRCAWKVAKVRGLAVGKSKLSTIFDSVDDLTPIDSTVHRYGALTGYIGRPKAHEWFDQPRAIAWGGGGKRTHWPQFCPRCMRLREAGTIGSALFDGPVDPWHRTTMTRAWCAESAPRGLPWRENPEM